MLLFSLPQALRHAKRTETTSPRTKQRIPVEGQSSLASWDVQGAQLAFSVVICIFPRFLLKLNLKPCRQKDVQRYTGNVLLALRALWSIRPLQRLRYPLSEGARICCRIGQYSTTSVRMATRNLQIQHSNIDTTATTSTCTTHISNNNNVRYHSIYRVYISFIL